VSAIYFSLAFFTRRLYNGSDDIKISRNGEYYITR